MNCFVPVSSSYYFSSLSYFHILNFVVIVALFRWCRCFDCRSKFTFTMRWVNYVTLSFLRDLRSVSYWFSVHMHQKNASCFYLRPYYKCLGYSGASVCCQWWAGFVAVYIVIWNHFERFVTAKIRQCMYLWFPSRGS